MTDGRTPADELASELRVLHKALMEAGQAEYEAAHGPIAGTTQLLQLLVEDPAFAWLRPLSELMADLDALIDAGDGPTDDQTGTPGGSLEPPATTPLGIAQLRQCEDTRAVRAAAEHLLSAAGGALWPALTRHLQAHAEVAAAYARVRQLLRALPSPGPADAGEALHARHRWAEIRRHRGPRRS